MNSRSPTDEDAPFVDEAEENEQLRRHYQKQYEAKVLKELRAICKTEKLTVRGSKAEVVARLVENEMRELEERWI